MTAVRKSPGDAFTSHLATSTWHSGQPIGDDELLHLLFELMLGGLHTVYAALGFTLVELARDPDQRQKLIDDPGLPCSSPNGTGNGYAGEPRPVGCEPVRW